MAKKLEIKAVLKAVDKATGPLRLAAHRIRRGLGGALRGVGSITRGVASKVASLASSLGLLGGAGIIGGLVAWTKSFVESGSELAKFARQVGLSAERLQELEYVAGLMDTTSGELRSALSVMARNVGAAKNKTGELYSELKRTDRGLLKQIKNTKSTAAAFDLLIGAMAAETDETKRARLAQIAFGRSGAKLIRFAEGGQVALAELSEEARKSGAIIPDEELRKTEEFSDSIHRTKMAFKAMTVVVMKSLLPILAKLMKSFQKWLGKAENQKKVAGFVKDMVNAFIEGVPKIVEFLKNAGAKVAQFVEDIGGLKTVGAAIAAAFILAMGPVGLLLVTIAALILAYQELDKYLNPYKYAFGKGGLKGALTEQRYQGREKRSDESVKLEKLMMAEDEKRRAHRASLDAMLSGAGAPDTPKLSLDSMLASGGNTPELSLEALTAARGKQQQPTAKASIDVNFKVDGPGKLQKVLTRSEPGVTVQPDVSQTKRGRRASAAAAP